MREFSAPSLSSRKGDQIEAQRPRLRPRGLRARLPSSGRSVTPVPAHEVREPGMTSARQRSLPNRSAIFRAALPFHAHRVPRVELGQDRLDARQEVQAGVGQRYGPRGPDEQRDADFALQRRDRRDAVDCGMFSSRPAAESFPCGRPERTAAARGAVAHSEDG